MSWKSPICTLNLTPTAEPAAISPTSAAECPTRKRLAKAASRLRNIDLVRNHRRDPQFGKAMEEQLVWRELLELELQEAECPGPSGPTDG